MLACNLLASGATGGEIAHVLDLIDKIVSWQIRPEFDRMGRSAILRLDSGVPIPTPTGTVTVRSIKIKGVGLQDHLGQVRPPQTQPYYRIHPHLGFGPDGRFIHVLSDPSPLGGITLDKAANEYGISLGLANSGCPSQIPLRLYEYDEPHLVFFHQGFPAVRLGVIAAALPEYAPVRADTALSLQTLDPDRTSIVLQWAADLGVEAGEYQEVDLAARICRLYGKTLRKFHQAGYYRYSGQPDNYAYSPQLGAVYLLDLDTSRRLGECPEVVKPLQLMRDVASALYGVTAYMLRRAHIARYGPGLVAGRAVFFSLLKGYYDELDEALLRRQAGHISDYYCQIYDLAEARHRETAAPALEETEDFQVYRRQTISQYWVNRDEVLSFFMAALWDLYQASALSIAIPQRISSGDMRDFIAAYTSPSFARSLWHLLGR